MLMYPAVDARLETESMKQYTDTTVWNGPITAIARHYKYI